MEGKTEETCLTEGVKRVINSPKYKSKVKKRNSERMSHWIPSETLELLKIIGERDTQAALRKMVHTRFIWEGIAAKMSTNRSAEHCHDRWIYLKRRYRETAVKKRTDRWASCYYYSELDKILAERTPGNDKSTVPSKASTASSSATRTTRSQLPGSSLSHLPDVPASDEEDDFEDDGDTQETDEEDIDDLFGPNRVGDDEVDLEGTSQMSENDVNQSSVPTGLPSGTSFNTTSAPNESRTTQKREGGPSQQNPKRPRTVRPKHQVPPKEDLSIAEAITDAMMRFIEHQQFHMSQQTEILQRYLKFERARMRWEMDMEVRRMKWEEERELREEERKQRQEEMEEKRVSDNREFMLQLAVVLGNPGSAGDSQVRTKVDNAEVSNSNAN